MLIFRGLGFSKPVKPDYSGPITIKGLITDAVVKITDISGNLIYETVAFGGQAVWDGKSFDGQKAHTGVYLVFVQTRKAPYLMLQSFYL